MNKEIVKLFKDQDTMRVQSVNIDLKKKWLNVFHDESEFSLSIENWNKLVAMVSSILPKEKEEC